MDPIALSTGLQDDNTNMEGSYSVYIITNNPNGTLYIGVTNNLQRRVWEHKKKIVKGFSSKYDLNRLVYFEVYDHVKQAIKREKQIKNLVRRKKIILIIKMNPRWNDLYNLILQ